MNRPTRIILGFSVQQLYRGLRSCDRIPSKTWHFALAKFALIAFKTAPFFTYLIIFIIKFI